jgi:hypothetical protein
MSFTVCMFAGIQDDSRVGTGFKKIILRKENV